MSGGIDAAGCALLVLVFFFQAEDGIRDGRVTGVQTCALPILRRSTWASRSGRRSSTPTRTRSSRPSWRRSRSEERRVGKEGGSRRGPEALKEKRHAEGAPAGAKKQRDLHNEVREQGEWRIGIR